VADYCSAQLSSMQTTPKYSILHIYRQRTGAFPLFKIMVLLNVKELIKMEISDIFSKIDYHSQ
jgi:hypothetical protein